MDVITLTLSLIFIQLVWTFLVLDWDQDKKSFSSKEALASFI